MNSAKSTRRVRLVVTRHRGGWGEPGKTYAIGLGCEIRHAHRLVYSDGLDLANASAATPIGMGCRVCERLDCPQRAAPPLGRTLRIDDHSSTFVPYPVLDGREDGTAPGGVTRAAGRPAP